MSDTSKNHGKVCWTRWWKPFFDISSRFNPQIWSLTENTSRKSKKKNWVRHVRTQPKLCWTRWWKPFFDISYRFGVHCIHANWCVLSNRWAMSYIILSSAWYSIKSLIIMLCAFIIGLNNLFFHNLLLIAFLWVTLY